MIKRRMAEVSHSPERRAYPRRSVAVAAFIYDASGDHLPCHVIDLAPNSARIEANEIALPNNFVLMLKLDRTVRRYCKIVWWKDYVAGVQFTAWPVGLR